MLYLTLGRAGGACAASWPPGRGNDAHPLLIAGGAIMVVLTFVAAVLITRHDFDRRSAKFLAQCHDAGFDAAKCRFFLTATGRMDGAAARR